MVEGQVEIVSIFFLRININTKEEWNLNSQVFSEKNKIT